MVRGAGMVRGAESLVTVPIGRSSAARPSRTTTRSAGRAAARVAPVVAVVADSAGESTANRALGTSPRWARLHSPGWAVRSRGTEPWEAKGARATQAAVAAMRSAAASLPRTIPGRYSTARSRRTRPRREPVERGAAEPVERAAMPRGVDSMSRAALPLPSRTSLSRSIAPWEELAAREPRRVQPAEERLAGSSTTIRVPSIR